LGLKQQGQGRAHAAATKAIAPTAATATPLANAAAFHSKKSLRQKSTKKYSEKLNKSKLGSLYFILLKKTPKKFSRKHGA
jgi:hypothetical protein